jgi:SAM-dependent methyltransferase
VRVEDIDAPARDVRPLYERHAQRFDAARGRALVERPYLDAVTQGVTQGGSVLDLGCGAGEPIAGYLIAKGFRVTGIDTAPAMIGICRDRFPEHDWRVADMRGLDLGRRFDAVVAWDSFFHLTGADQRAMFGVFTRHLQPGGRLLFTAGPAEGEAIGDMFGDPLFHYSLDPGEYDLLLQRAGLAVEVYKEKDADCGDHTVWLARRV